MIELDRKTIIAKELYSALDDLICPYRFDEIGGPKIEDFSRMKGNFINDDGEDCGTTDLMVDVADVNRALSILEKYRGLK